MSRLVVEVGVVPHGLGPQEVHGDVDHRQLDVLTAGTVGPTHQCGAAPTGPPCIEVTLSHTAVAISLGRPCRRAARRGTQPRTARPDRTPDDASTVRPRRSPLIEHMISSGLISESTDQPTPSRSSAPGRKFCTSTSASRTSCFNRALPATCFRSTAMVRLFRFIDANMALMPSVRHQRPGVPDDVGSIGPFDHDDVSALIGQHGGGERPGDHRGHVDHSHTRQRPVIEAFGN